jgi:hypothetical protein
MKADKTRRSGGFCLYGRREQACRVHALLMVPEYDMHMAEIVLRRTYYPAIFVARVVNTIVGIIEVALAVRIVLELFGASSSSLFVAWIYGVTSAMIGSFSGAFPGLVLSPGSVIDLVAILAMIGYAILGWIVVRLLMFIFNSMNMI